MNIRTTRSKKVRTAIGASLVVAAAGVAVGHSGTSTPTPAYALPAPTNTPNRMSPGGFLPAPNPNPYCSSMEYFNYFPENIRAIQIQDNIVITEDTAHTNLDGTGIAMTFKTVQQSASVNSTPGAPSGGVPTPMVTYGADSLNRGLASIGIVMNGGDAVSPPAIAEVTLSEPLFYSQWVFTDLDQPDEGFDLTPTWTTTDTRYQRYGMYGPDNGGTPTSPGWSFMTATPSDRDHVGFYSLVRENVDGSDLQGRFQIDFYGPVSALRMARYGLGGSGFATGAGCPPIGISKSATTPVWNAATQKFEVQYVMKVKNNLPSQEQLDAAIAAAEETAHESQIVGDAATPIDAIGVQITDALDLTGFKAADVTSLTGTGFTVNPNYDGVTDINLLAGDDDVPAEGDAEIVLDVAYTPDFTDPDWNDCKFATSNQSEVTAMAAGVSVSDLSDNGGDASPGSDNGSGTTDDPTPVEFGTIACQVGLAKNVVDGSTINNGDGTYTTTYDFKVGNYGVVNLSHFVLNDDLNAAYGDAFVNSTITSDTCTALDATGGLAPGAFCDITMDVVFKPISGIEDPWINQATITANVGPDEDSALTTTDASQDGVEPDPDGDGDPTNNTEPTPNAITAQIGLAKRVTEGPTNNGDGTYDVVYSLVATNMGFAYLSNIVVDDDLKATFGDALVGYESNDGCATAVLPQNGSTCEVVISVTFRPGTQLRWENSATVTGDAGGTTVTDVSQDGVDPDPDGDGNPGNNSDPTPIEIGNSPAIKIEKARTTPAVEQVGDDGQATVEYDLIVTNVGDVQLTDITITDDLTATFGADRFISGGITENSCVGVTLLAANQEGGPGSCTAHVVAVVKPGTDLGPDTNVASVTGTAPDGAKVAADSNPVDVEFRAAIPPTTTTTTTTTPRPITNPDTGVKPGAGLALAGVLFGLGSIMLLLTRRRDASLT